MTEFLQSYGIWIIFGLLFLFMLRGRGHGMGCGMGGHYNRDGEQKRGAGGIRVDDDHRPSGCH